MNYIDGNFIIGYPNDVGACINNVIDFKKYSKSDLKQVILANCQILNTTAHLS